MGWQFSLEHGNVAAYMTAPGKSVPPRLTRWQLREFLGILQGEYRAPPLFSSDPDWIPTVVAAAQDAARFVDSLKGTNDSFLDPSAIEKALAELRGMFGSYKLYGLVVAGRASHQELTELDAFVKHAAMSSRHHALFLMPDYRSDQKIDVLDPFPAMAKLAEQPENWPGLLFWSKSGQAAFAPLRDSYDLYNDLLKVLDRDPKNIDQILIGYRSQKTSKKLLHLSDLHFGTPHAVQNEAYLSARLDSVGPSVDRVVITGDLFNNPKREEALAFRNFRASLRRRTGKDAIVIPGNHDQRWLGLSNPSLGELANLEWSSLVIDEEMNCVFFCFDSSRDADLARGRITSQQMVDVATLFETNCVGRDELRNYLPVALIHHHPFSFETQKETFVSRLFARIGLTDEMLLRMDEADKFLTWCAKRRIPLILHGHKHVQRFVRQWISFPEGASTATREVTAVGCGSSLGAEGKALSYNILTWDPVSQHWGVSFFADPGDGSGWTLQRVAMHSVA